MKLSPATRISFALVLVTASILMLADLIGLTPRGTAETLEARKSFSEVVAVVFSAAIQKNEISLIKQAMQLAVERNDDLLSMGLRARTGDLIATAGDHQTNWDPPTDDVSTPTHWQVPIIKGTEQWGLVEVVYRPPPIAKVMGLAVAPLIALLLFVSLAGFIGYKLLMGRVLRHLDPSAVIPHHVQATLDVLAEGVAIFDRNARIVLANSAFAKTVGHNAADLLGKNADALSFELPPEESGTREFPWVAAIAEGSSQLGVRLIWNDGGEATRIFVVNGAPVLDGSGSVLGALATFDDLTQVEEKNVQLEQMLSLLEASRDEVRRQNEQLHVLATRDPMTGCLNRRAFFKEFGTLFERSVASGGVLGCIMTDIDHFKSFNDRYGHSVGDDVIKRVAAALQAGLRGDDVLCRYGGEEFCIVFPGLDVAGTARVAERLRRKIEANTDDSLEVTCSFGVSELFFGAADPAQLIDQADQALYHAKESGRNRVSRWNEVGVATEESDGAAQAAAVVAIATATAANDERQPSTAVKVGAATQTRVFDLEENERWYGEVFDVLASMSELYADLTTPSGAASIFSGTRRLLKRLLPFEATALAMRQDDGSLQLVDWDPEEHHERIGQELLRLDQDATLRQAMQDSGLARYPSQDGAHTLLLHSLATESLDMGVFVGLLDKDAPMPDHTVCNAIAIVMHNAARAIESAQLYRLLRAEHQALQNDLGERTRELLHDRSHDGLTGLPNQALFHDRIEQAISRCQRYGKHGAVVMLDLDRFKRVNKLLGRAGGDQLLKITGERIDAALRATDSVARVGQSSDDALISRLGGDEFGILVTDLAEPGDIHVVVNRLMRALSKPYVIENREFFITISIGISMLLTDGDNTEVLISNAETAMCQAKATRRNHYSFYSPEAQGATARQLDLEDRLRSALREEQLHLHYQPKINVQTGRITGFEALLRWRDPELGNVSPGEFIPVAELSGLIVPIGAWVLRTACRDAKCWHDAGSSDVSVAVNLSVVQILQSEIVDEIAATLEETGLPPHLLEVEITESTIMHQLDRATAILRRLSEAGIKIAIDDFGTGYSSLNYLKRFPVDSLKIDGSFIRDLVADSSDLAIVKATLAMAHGMGISAVAECVETQEQMSLIRSLDCDEVQGYFFSKPLAFDDAMEHLACWQGEDELLWTPDDAAADVR